MVGTAVAVDIMFNNGGVSKEVLKQVAVGGIFNAADQLLSGESLDGEKALGDAIGNADLFDAGVDGIVKKMPGGVIVSEVLEHTTPAMGDITLNGGVQLGGVNKDMSDVAIDASFSIVADNIKGVEVPKMKFSGNTLVKNVKNSIIDYTSDHGSDATKNMSLPTVTNRPSGTYTDPRLVTRRVQDNTRVRTPVIKKRNR